MLRVIPQRSHIYIRCPKNLKTQMDDTKMDPRKVINFSCVVAFCASCYWITLCRFLSGVTDS